MFYAEYEMMKLFKKTLDRNKQAVFDKTNTIWSQTSECVCWSVMDMFVPPKDSQMVLLMLWQQTLHCVFCVFILCMFISNPFL